MATAAQQARYRAKDAKKTLQFRLDPEAAERLDTLVARRGTAGRGEIIELRQAYAAKVDKGFVAYIRGANKLLEVPITESAVEEVPRPIDEIFAIITTGRLPKRTSYKVRCRDCCYKNICV
jgi:CRISPR/Cas system-associated exonuclease Cas4 (RecB family)